VSIAARIAEIKAELPPGVRLVAVTKQVDVAAMMAAYDAGIRDFGESRVLEASRKREAFRDYSDITWHLIGHLQSNKARKAVEIFDWIHSVDSLHLIEKLALYQRELQRYPRLCLQVKMRPDPNKYGWTQGELLADLPQINSHSELRICGLMAIPPQSSPAAEITAIFTETADLARSLDSQPTKIFSWQELSMGMSQDYLLGVSAGATIVRIGSTIFGDRDIHNS
jgi:pyridoxal phosphate enzyme (YggS family)